MHSPPADHPDNSASVLIIFLPEVSFAFSDHIQHPAKVILPDFGRIKWYQSHFGWMFGLLKKSKLQQDVYFPFKTVLEKEQMIFGNKKQFASNGFDFVQKQRNQRKRQNKFDDDEKWIRSGDCPFTKAKRSNRDVSDQNELQTYASLEKMLHKAIHVVRQLKKKGNTNTSSAPKQQSNSSSPSNSDLKTNVLSSDKSKAVKTTSKALSTRCFKCHRVGHYANKCQKQKSLVTLEKVETEPEKKDPLPIFDDYDMNRMKGHVESKIVVIKKDLLPFTNRTELKEGNDVPRFVDQSIGANQHGDQDVLNNLTELRLEPRPDDRLPVLKLVFPDQLDILRPMVEPDLAWVVKKPKTDMHSHPADHPDSPASVLIIFRALTRSSILHFPCLDQI
ncbi:hypothetical protein F2Q69_00041669 [Brassica cretica]|uniref:CCHC-type domain-containing protein n=1 Tax=Brassica cretica TaxID=69181 RepID=A0A8S9NEC8_BRACR|nr:hypothetical protein F2Q69_00041669 [Brassica cretica]